MAYELKKGDRRPHYRIQLTANATPVNLTDATSVTFLMRPARGGALKVNAAGTFIDRPTGIVEYAWGATDTNTVGVFEMQVQIDWTGEKQTFPSSGVFLVTIRPI